MAQDLREMFERNKDGDGTQLKDGHKQRFMKRLEEELPQRKRTSYYTLKIAASVVLCLGLAGYLFTHYTEDATELKKENAPAGIKEISLGDLSPDLKKVEDYYVSSIGIELSRIRLTDKNKALIDSFMQRLEELDQEYAVLTKELNEIGPNDQTITALIKNLQLRLELLQRLKVKLNELKSSKNEKSPVI